MKKYISLILISCLLMQFFGCYSPKEISLEELPNSEDAIIITKDSTVFKLNKNISTKEILTNPNIYFSRDWIVKQNTEMITLKTQKAYKENERGIEVLNIKQYTVRISYKEISNVLIEKINVGNTILVGLIPVALCGIAYLIWASLFE